MSTIAITTTTETFSPPRSRAVTIGLCIAALTFAFFIIEHASQISTLQDYSWSSEEMIERANQGDLVRRMGFPAIAVLGIVLLLRRDGRRLELKSHLGWMLLIYFAWCGASTLWSTDIPLTLRRLVILSFGGLGALGLARQVTLREFCMIALGVTTLLVTNGVCTEIALGTFRPFASNYRFAGTLHPNMQATYCATMALSAACLATRAKRGRFLLWSLCLTGVALLVLTKSRTTTGAFLVGLLVLSLYGVPWPKKILVGSALLGAGATIIWFALMLGWDVERQVTNVAMIGRQEESGELSGRIPIWTSMLPYLEDHLLVGYGYQTFWSPARIESVADSVGYVIPHAHSAYLDAALDIGLIGVIIFLTVVLLAFRSAGRAYLSTGDVGFLFLLALLACRSLNSVLESNFATPNSFVPFLTLCGLIHLGYSPRETEYASVADFSQEIEI